MLRPRNGVSKRHNIYVCARACVRACVRVCVCRPDGCAVHDGVDVVDKLITFAGPSMAQHVPLVHTVHVTH